MLSFSARVDQTGSALVVTVPRMRSHYLDHLMRRNCFEELRPLFMHAHAPAKEMTESYAAMHHLRRSLTHHIPECLVLHIGDGAHCRTGAMFAFLSKARNICIDPNVNPDVMTPWMARWNVQRLSWFAGRVEDFPLEEIDEPCLVTFVHAHVNTDAVLRRIPNWRAAYVNPCCHPNEQRSRGTVVAGGHDWAILSPEREYQVILNERAQGGCWLPNGSHKPVHVGSIPTPATECAV